MSDPSPRLPAGRLTTEQFVAWAMEQPETEHYELYRGEVVAVAAAACGAADSSTAVSGWFSQWASTSAR